MLIRSEDELPAIVQGISPDYVDIFNEAQKEFQSDYIRWTGPGIYVVAYNFFSPCDHGAYIARTDAAKLRQQAEQLLSLVDEVER